MLNVGDTFQQGNIARKLCKYMGRCELLLRSCLWFECPTSKREKQSRQSPGGGEVYHMFEKHVQLEESAGFE